MLKHQTLSIMKIADYEQEQTRVLSHTLREIVLTIPR